MIASLHTVCSGKTRSFVIGQLTFSIAWQIVLGY